MDESPVNPLSAKCVSFLENVYDDRRVLFPFSTRVKDGKYDNDYEGNQAVRYTINSLLGLKEALRSGADMVFVKKCPTLVEAFMKQHYGAVSNYGDLGLLLVMICDLGERRDAADVLRRIGDVVARGGVKTFNVQEMSWMLWGAAAAARCGHPDAEGIARRMFRAVHDHFLCRDSLLPRHSLRVYRRNIVSFGSITYFLRGIYEYATVCSDEYALTLFKEGVGRIMDLQGPYGEWPWLVHVRTAKPLDFYPVFSVHQDAMAMLFLLPALDAGLATAREATNRSFAWVHGHNQLGLRMIHDEPFLIVRSIRRRDRFERERRYVRSIVMSLTGRNASLAGNSHVEINPECRSYHIGWILYVWSNRSDFPDIVSLRNVRDGGYDPKSLSSQR